MSAIGFDVGNENSYIAAVISGGVEVLDNDYNIRATPSYITFTERSRDVGVGAKAKVCPNLENTVFGFKRILGKKFRDPDVNNELEYLPQVVLELPNGDIAIQVNYLENSVKFRIPQLMAIMLTKLKLITENKLRAKIRDCVISVPVYYTDAQRRALLDSAKIANLNPLRLMNESTAVALAHGFYQQNLSEQSKNVVFIDVGNSATTVTACALTKENLKILATVWDDVGGRDFDSILVKHFADEFKDKNKIDALSSKKAVMTLWNECETIKKLMSASQRDVNLNIECLMNELDVKSKINQSVFVQLSANLLDRIKNVMQQLLDETKLLPNEIDSVEIVGGSCRMPAVKHCIEQIFGRLPNTTLNQDEAVARGCALQCALLSPSLKTRDFIIEDISSFLIYATWKNAELKEEKLDVFTLSDKIPSSRKITFCMNKAFTFQIFSVNRRVSSGTQKIGKYAIGNIPTEAQNGYAEITVNVSLDIHGVFSITSASMIVKTENRVVLYEDKHDEEMDATDKNIDVSKMDSENDIPDNDVKYFELSVTPDVDGMSQGELDRFKDAEKEMLQIYFKEKEKADARNALEEFIYDIREKLKGEFLEYMEEKEDTNELLRYLDDIQQWLDDNEDQDSSGFLKKLHESKLRFGAIFKKHFQWNQISSFANEYQIVMDKTSRVFDQLSHYTSVQQEVQNLKKIWQNTKESVDKSLEACLNQKKYEDPMVSAQDLRVVLTNFNDNYEACLSRICNKVESSAQSSSGDGNVTKTDKTVDVASHEVNEEEP